ncbi:MAG: hypothetical protein ACOX6P_07755 [Candidatus Merdivicinus sp.]|jgi:spore maturation protein SpmB
MKKFRVYRAGMREMLLLTAGVGMGVLLLKRSGEAAEGVRQGISVCLEHAIPALFLFMIFADYLTLSGTLELIARPLGFLARILGIPKKGVPVFLLSLVGGYPVGPKILGKMVKKGELSVVTAEKMLCYTVNGSPAFLLAGVAIPCFANTQIGLILAGSQMLSAFLVGILVRILWGSSRSEKQQSLPTEPPLPAGDAFVRAVTEGGQSMLMVCGYVIVFSVLAHGLDFIPGASVWCGFLEVTVGCARLPGGNFWEMIVLGAGYTAFGGICVWMQAASMLRGTGVRMRKFFLMRGVHIFFSLLFSIFFVKRMKLPAEVFSTFSHAIPERGGATAGAAVLLVLICLLVLIGNHKKTARITAK